MTQKLISRSVVWLVSLALCFASIYRVYLHTVHATALAWSGYAYSDLLINYASGFIRRGLVGACIHHLANGAPALATANRLLWINFTFLVCAFVLLVLVSEKRSPRTLLLSIVIPGGFLAMAATNESYYRKEMLFYSSLTTLAIALSLLRRLPHSTLKRLGGGALIALIFAFGLALPLVHEAFIFLSAPAFLLLLLAIAHEISPAGSALRLQSILARTYIAIQVILLLIVSRSLGSPRAAQTIWSSLNPLDRNLISGDGTIAGGIETIDVHGLAASFPLPFHILLSGMVWYWVLPLLGLMLYCMGLAAWGLRGSLEAKQSEYRQNIAAYLFLALCASPAFLLAWDWGRWVAAINISFLIVWLAIAPGSLQQLLLAIAPKLPNPLRSASSAVIRLLSGYAAFIVRHKRGACLFLLLFALTFRLPESTPDDTTYIANLGKSAALRLLHHLHPPPGR